MAVAGAAAALGGLGTAASAAARNKTASAASTSEPQLTDAGMGMHATPTTLDMLAIAEICRDLVSCSVGQMGLDPSAVAQLSAISQLQPILNPVIGKGWTGPFAMLMFSQNVTSYQIDRANGVLQAKGVLRSITKMGGALVEDAYSPYLAIATDGKRTGADDSFFLNYHTPFWSSPNPLATPSKYVQGWSMFGGNFIIGEVNVSS